MANFNSAPKTMFTYQEFCDCEKLYTYYVDVILTKGNMTIKRETLLVHSGIEPELQTNNSVSFTIKKAITCVGIYLINK